MRLQVGDIDGDRLMIHVRGGKGNVDRYVPLPRRTLELLREFWKTHRNPRLLFPSRGHSGIQEPTATRPLCPTTLQKAFIIALKASGVRKQAHIHTLRHSYATHLPEQGENLKQLQVNMGHWSPEVTARYTHLTSLCQRLLFNFPYSLITFTVPDAIRTWMRSHPTEAYNLLFECSWEALKELAANPKRLGAQLGAMGVLQTWSIWAATSSKPPRAIAP